MASAQPQEESLIVPNAPPSSVCIFQDGTRGCTAFEVEPFVFITAAHCLSDIDWPKRSTKVTSIEKLKLYCPTALNDKNPTKSLNRFSFAELHIRDFRIHESYFQLVKSGKMPLTADLAIVLTVDHGADSKISRMAKSETEILQLVKQNKCRTAGYSRGFYAEIPAFATKNPIDGESHLLSIDGGNSFGDSGGPIFCKDANGEDVTTGMTVSVIGDLSAATIHEWLSRAFKPRQENLNIEIPNRAADQRSAK